MVERLEPGERPGCVPRALSQPGVVAVKDAISVGGDCPVAKKGELLKSL